MSEIKYLTLKEAAEILNVSTRTLANLAISGQISAYRLPSAAGVKSRYRFKLADLENFMAGLGLYHCIAAPEPVSIKIRRFGIFAYTFFPHTSSTAFFSVSGTKWLYLFFKCGLKALLTAY